MSYGMYMSAMAAEAQNRVLQVISNNLANVSTPGFKRELAVVQARSSEAIEMGLDDPLRENVNNVGGGIQMHESLTDFSLGTLKKTGIKTDLALRDPASFFLVEKDGQRLLTRAGNFEVNSRGNLVTTAGHAVLDSGGAAVNVDLTAPYEFLPSGQVSQPGTLIDLGIVQANSPADLARAGENMFRALGPVQDATNQQREVQSGFLEQSAVKPTQEMLQMIRTSRAYEANIRMIQNHDNISGQLFNRVLRQ